MDLRGGDNFCRCNLVVFTYMSNFTLVQKAKGMLKNVWTGMKSIWYMEHKMRFVIETLLIWGGYFCYFYITFYAFDFTKDLGIVVGLITFTMSSIGVAVPVQGGIGPWHFMVIATLVCFGVNENDAAAFALVVHTVQTVWTGIVRIIRSGSFTAHQSGEQGGSGRCFVMNTRYVLNMN